MLNVHRILSIHEAGHVTVALALGHEIIDVWISDTEGGCVIEPEPCATVLLAGFVANTIDTGIAPDWDWLDGGDPCSDVWRARQLGEDFAAAVEEARAILIERWAEVEEVASMLSSA